MSIGRVGNSILQSPAKLQDPGDISIPCCIGDVQIEGALCDLGAGVSLMPLSLYLKLRSLKLTPTTISVQLADGSTRRPIGILEDVPVKEREIIIPCDFFVLDMDESSYTPIILGRPFLATAGAKIDVKAGTISFEILGKRVDFCLPLAPVICPSPVAPMPAIPSATSSRVEVFDGGGCPYVWPTAFKDPLLIPSTSGAISVDTGELVESAPPFYTPTSTSFASSPFTIWRQGSS